MQSVPAFSSLICWGRIRLWWGHWPYLCLPELVSLAHGVFYGTSLLQFYSLALLIRLAWVTAEVIHGTGHTLMRALVDRTPEVICPENLLEHRSPRQLLRTLLPLAPIGLAGTGLLPSAWLHGGDPAPWKLRLKASGGILLHLMVIAGASMAMQPWDSAYPAVPWVNQLLLAMSFSNACLALASWTDIGMVITGRGSLLHCGNFGLVAAPEVLDRRELLPNRVIDIVHRMGRETELRGAQAGGGLVLSLDRQGEDRFVGHRIVNAKRGDLTTALEAGFRKQRRRARHRGCRPHPAGLLACWHYRFGTSGPPAVRETHWQEWTPGRRCRLWRQVDDGRWQSTRTWVHHRITHNGDFEGFHAFGAERNVAFSLGPWLEKALQQPSPARVDSARIAGMMDLLICQGDWFAAVRWAFLSTLAVYPRVPPLDALQRWAALFEETFLDQVVRLNSSSRELFSDGAWMPPFQEVLLGMLRQDPLLQQQEESRLRCWIHRAIDLFLRNDPFEAMREFMEGARGSFGLVVASTTWPDQLVLCSLGQPLTIGMDPQSRMGLYASESAAVDAVLTGREGAWRMDLDEDSGEIAVLSSEELRVTSLSLDREISPQELGRRRDPYCPRVPIQPEADSSPYPASRDPVAADIAEIPALLAAIQDDWATVAAMHHTLTQLLFTLSRQLLQAFPDLAQSPLGMQLSRDELTLLDNLEANLFLQECGEIVGVAPSGQPRPTPTSRGLEREGRRWAQHVLEAPLAWGIQALYILISVSFGIPLMQTLLRQVVGIVPMMGAGEIGPLLKALALAADVGLYIFGPWLWTLLLRQVQGRPLLARTGRRCLVVGEAPLIQLLLTNYISKLFSLSYGITALDVQGADVGDDLLHTHAHRLVRGTLLFFGIPDGRCSTLGRAQADAAMLTARQADGIRHWGTGPEIVAIGSEPSLPAGPFSRALLVPCYRHEGCADGRTPPGSLLVERLHESRFGSFKRLLGSHLFFWSMAREVGRLPLLRFRWWRSQSRTRVMTTAAPVSAARLDLPEPREIAAIALDRFSGREQS